MKEVIGLAIFFLVIFIFASVKDSSKRDEMKNMYQNEAQQAGVKQADLVGTYRINTYKFRDKENSGIGDPFNKDENYPPSGVLLCDRTRPLDLSWDFNMQVFWASEPAVSIESPATDRVIIEEKSGPPPSVVAINYVNSPRIVLKFESDNMQPHIIRLRLENMQVAIADRNSKGQYEYRYRSIEPSVVSILLK
ncbi:MAG: hypothetical protein V3W31_05875 [Thermodesulfobacteriota bacterium]